MANSGRPRILDSQKTSSICTIVAAGGSLRAAARYVGCSINTIRREALRNESFKKQLGEAQLHAHLSPLKALRDAYQTHWRAAAWMLERTNPRQFARPSPKGYNPEEVSEILEEIIETASEEIEDHDVRYRVCRRILLAAQGAFDEDAQRRFNERRTARRPLRADERALDSLLREVDDRRDEAVKGLARSHRK
jgi:hypothetical protein